MRAKHLPIANPCHEDWDAMKPDARGRFCGACDKAVFDLSALTEAEAKVVLARHRDDKICISYCLSRDGVVQFAPPPVTRGRVVAAGVLAVAVAACAPHEYPGTAPAIEIEIQTRAAAAVQPIETRVEPTAPPHVAPPPVEHLRYKGDWAGPDPTQAAEITEDEPCDREDPAAGSETVRVKGGLG